MISANVLDIRGNLRVTENYSVIVGSNRDLSTVADLYQGLYILDSLGSMIGGGGDVKKKRAEDLIFTSHAHLCFRMADPVERQHDTPHHVSICHVTSYRRVMTIVGTLMVVCVFMLYALAQPSEYSKLSLNRTRNKNIMK